MKGVIIMKLKKILSIASTFVITAGLSINVSAASKIRGDANGDNKFDIRDAAYIAKCLVKGDTPDPMADYNEDGKIDIRDASAIAKTLVGSSDSVEKEVLDLVNAERKKVGAAPLKLNSTLNAMANVRAIETASSFSHSRPNGTSCFTIFEDYAVSYSYVGENLAAANSSSEATVKQWINSEGHYANMINPEFTELGVGFHYDPNSEYKYYWVQIFRRP